MAFDKAPSSLNKIARADQFWGKKKKFSDKLNKQLLNR